MIVAAIIAEFANSVTSEVADAAAAIVVSILILMSLLPLFSGMIHTYTKLQTIRERERMEQLRLREDEEQDTNRHHHSSPTYEEDDENYEDWN